MDDRTEKRLRQLPSISALLEHPVAQSWLGDRPRAAVVRALRSASDQTRAEIRKGLMSATDADSLVALAERLLDEQVKPSLRRVINATGIVLHTGLGRAVLPAQALEAMQRAAGYTNLEFDLATGKRGQRQDHVAGLLCELTDAEAATVVNNNAAATLLILNTLCNGREAVVSRGQLIEIGGSYRLPDVMIRSGAIMREVGTTNRTRLADYAKAINAATGLLVHVHTSNYLIQGFVESVGIVDLATLGRERNLPVYDDLGSGALFDFTQFGLPPEPTAADSIRAGADVVSFSADKLLGGPQGGVIVGRGHVVDRLMRNPLARTYRPDKITLAALEATLHLWRDPISAAREIPALRMLTSSQKELAERAEKLKRMLAEALPGESFEVAADVSYAGGGALPTKGLPTRVVRWRPVTWSAEGLQARLRELDPPIVVRVTGEAVLIDVRTVSDSECEVFARAVRGLSLTS